MKNAVEVLIDRDRLKAQMVLTGHATAKEFVTEAIRLLYNHRQGPSDIRQGARVRG